MKTLFPIRELKMSEISPSLTPASERLKETVNALILSIDQKMREAAKEEKIEIELLVTSYNPILLDSLEFKNLFLLKGYTLRWVHDSKTGHKEKLLISWLSSKQ